MPGRLFYKKRIVWHAAAMSSFSLMIHGGVGAMMPLSGMTDRFAAPSKQALSS